MVEHFGVEEALLYENAVPIAALGFVACKGVGELYLKGVVVFVLFDVVLYEGFVAGVLAVMCVELVVELLLFVGG